MGKILAIANHKGGVGKTSLATNLADTFRQMGVKTLLIDLDSQHNATDVFCAKIEDEYTMVDILTRQCTAKEAIQHTEMGDIIAGDALLATIQRILVRENDDETLAYLLGGYLKNLKNEYNYIIIDTSPALDIYMEMALCCADELIVPITAQPFATTGLSLLMNVINDTKAKYNPRLKFLGVVVNIYDQRNAMDREVKEKIKVYGDNLGFEVMNYHIRISQEVKKAQGLYQMDEEGNSIPVNKSLFVNYPKCNAANNYVHLAEEIINYDNYHSKEKKD